MVQMLAFCHSEQLFSSVSVVCLTSVSVQTQVASVMRALDCDHAQPRIGHQIWSQASQVKKSPVSSLHSLCGLHRKGQKIKARTQRLVKHLSFPSGGVMLRWLGCSSARRWECEVLSSQQPTVRML